MILPVCRAYHGLERAGLGVRTETDMGKFAMGLFMGLLIGLIFSEQIFPDGFGNAVQHWGEQVRSKVPGR